MGKKRFIDRKKAITFHLVHRSQQDPLVADENAPQHVLVPSNGYSKADDLKRKEEQRKYGIFFDDDYNYLQHLRSASEMRMQWEPAPRYRASREDFPPFRSHQVEEEPVKPMKIQLPSSVFASEVEEEVGMLNKQAEYTGLCLNVDPDVVAAMDDDFDFDNPDNVLEDNFIELANAEDEEEEEEENYSDVSSTANQGDSSDEDEIRSLNGPQFTFAGEETRSRFTNYSMSSSVMRRNENLSLLDNKFEQLYATYDDNEIGALDCEDIEGYIDADSPLIKQCIDEFECEKQKATLEQEQEIDKTLKLLENVDSDVEVCDMDVIEVPDKTEKWDCESILSTYSNLYNHPKLISEPKTPGRIRVSARTGIPLNVLDGSGSQKLTAKSLAKLDASLVDKQNRAESVISTLSALSIRPKNETPDEKRERKKSIKLYRKERRMERKANTFAFKEEKKRQEKVLLNNKLNQQGIKIL